MTDAIKLPPTIAIDLPQSVFRRGACRIGSAKDRPIGQTTENLSPFGDAGISTLDSIAQISSVHELCPDAIVCVIIKKADRRIECKYCIFMAFCLD